MDIANDSPACAVYGCCNRKEINSGNLLAFFKMPNNLTTLTKWIKACGRRYFNALLKEKNVEYFHNNFVVCSDHFEIHCFRNMNLQSQSLFPEAIPTLKLPDDGAAPKYNSSSTNGSVVQLDTICNICLSEDRELRTMSNMVITQEWKDIGLNIKKGVLCWECRAFVNKVSCFKTKALLAQQVLKGKIMHSNVDCLSSLGTAVNKKVIIFKEETNPIGCDQNDGVDINFGDKIKVEVLDEDALYCEAQEFEIDIEENFVGVQDTALITNIKEELAEEKLEDNLVNDVNNGGLKKIVNRKPKKVKNTLKNVDYVVCKLSDEELMQHRDRDRTMMCCSNSKWICNSCIICFRSEAKYKEHVRQFHSEESGSFVCHICACRFHDQRALKSHAKKHNVLYKCLLCKHARFYSRLATMNSHIRINHSSNYECKICKMWFNSRISLNYHYKTHNAKDCEVCGKTVICLKSHMESHDTSPQVCTVCQKRLKSRKSLRRHMLTHTTSSKDEAYCAECDIHFKNKYLYRIHLKYTVSHVKADKECDYCHKMFTRKFTLATHINLVHYNKSEHSCPTCEKLFKSRGSLNRHIKFVHDKMAMTKKYECVVCDRKFTVKRLLNNHMNVHTGERPHKCDLCESTFAQTGALYKHRQLVHKIVKSKC